MERLKTDLTTANSSEQVDHDKVRRIEAEIAECEDGDIREALEKRSSLELFDDEKPTATFLKMKTSKGKSEVTRLRIPNKFFNKNIPEHPLTNIKYFNVTDQNLIRVEMQMAFQSIYKKQDLLATSSDGIVNFLNSDEDIRPANEQMKKLHGCNPNRRGT